MGGSGMKETYEEAISKVFEDEGGYSNDPGDSGGPTNWGITIADARHYWKADATEHDVRHMPKSVAEDIYKKHYAAPLHYDELPPGVDYAVLDYGINSGIYRAEKVYREVTSQTLDPEKIINMVYDERLRFLKGLRIWRIFGKGWGRRVREGRKLALYLYNKYKTKET
jgi:lysozyme family protein